MVLYMLACAYPKITMSEMWNCLFNICFSVGKWGLKYSRLAGIVLMIVLECKIEVYFGM